MTGTIAPGQEIGPIEVSLSPSLVSDYVAAVSNSNEAGGDTPRFVPAAGLAAFALGALLKSIGLPPGTMHLAQEFAAHKAVTIGETLACKGRIGQRSQRRDGVFWTVEFTLASAQGSPVMEGKATLLTPGEGG